MTPDRSRAFAERAHRDLQHLLAAVLHQLGGEVTVSDRTLASLPTEWEITTQSPPPAHLGSPATGVRIRLLAHAPGRTPRASHPCQVADSSAPTLCPGRESGGLRCEVPVPHRPGHECAISEHTQAHDRAGNGYACVAIDPPPDGNRRSDPDRVSVSTAPEIPDGPEPEDPEDTEPEGGSGEEDSEDWDDTPHGYWEAGDYP